jgi:heme-degrading monooxygenase HmoA
MRLLCRLLNSFFSEDILMFSVIFEVRPHTQEWETYLGFTQLLRPELFKVEGFIDNVRYRSLTRKGWLLSLSGWRDEKSLIRWRTQAGHHGIQEKGRGGVLADYHLRVGQITNDSHIPEGQALTEQRLDETETGEGTAMVLVDTRHAAEWVKTTGVEEVAASLGLDSAAPGLEAWDVFDAVLSPGDVILLTTWRDQGAAEEFAKSVKIPQMGRLRQARVVRDYGMFDRREAPQYYPEVKKRRPIEGHEAA